MKDVLSHPGITISMAIVLLGLGFIVYRWAVKEHVTLEYFKMLFGFLLLLMITALGAALAFGNIDDKEAQGFNQILTIISVLSGGFAQWAFNTQTRDKTATAPPADAATPSSIATSSLSQQEK